VIELKPLDVVVAVMAAAIEPADWTIAAMAEALGVSSSQAFRSAQQAAAVGFLHAERAGRRVTHRVHRAPLIEFLTHGVRYAFVPEHGRLTRGVPTAHAAPVLASHFRATMDLSNAVVVSPDFGNAKQAGHFARRLGIGMAAGSKRRQADDSVVIDAIVGDVEGRDVIVLDDEIATGGSIVTLIEKIKEYDVNSIRVACTHGLFTGNAAQRLNACGDIAEVVATNTVPANANVERLTVISVAPLFAEAIRRIHSGESISGLFSPEDTYGD